MFDLIMLTFDIIKFCHETFFTCSDPSHKSSSGISHHTLISCLGRGVSVLVEYEYYCSMSTSTVLVQ